MIIALVYKGQRYLIDEFLLRQWLAWRAGSPMPEDLARAVRDWRVTQIQKGIK